MGQNTYSLWPPSMLPHRWCHIVIFLLLMSFRCNQTSQSPLVLLLHFNVLHWLIAWLCAMLAGSTSDPQQSKLQQQSLIMNELLRHFWACIPCSSPFREQKAKRMTEQLAAQQEVMVKVLTNLGQHAAVLNMAVQPVRQAVQKAQNRFELEQSRHAIRQHASLIVH